MNTYVASDHVTNNLWIDGRLIYRGIEGMLRDKKDKMILRLRETLDILRRTEGSVMDSNLMMEMGYISAL